MVMGVPERLDPPIVIGDMTLVALLGEGGMASVYLGGVGSGALARPAAIKLLRPDLADADYRGRFLDEAKVVVHLHHNNVVDVHRAGEHQGQLYIAMECVDGRDLADLWDRCAELGRAFPLPLAVHVVREVLRGLHYAHTRPGLGLVHRDVSPSNILVDWAGAVRLADFGLATSTLKASMTVPGIVFGKVNYMAPEQATRAALDGRADVYACGVILWELITGRSMRDPSDRDTAAAAAFHAVPPSHHSRRVDATLDGIVMKSLANDRDDRYPSAAAMLEDLGRWLVAQAPDTGQESVARFMHELFGDAGEREREAREQLMADLRRSGPHRTRLLPAGAAAAASLTGAPRVDTEQLAAGAGAGAKSGRGGQAARAGELGAGAQGPDPQRAVGPEAAVPVPVGKPPRSTAGSGSETRPDLGEYIPAGTVIAERYRVLSQLGRGGMGTVFLGEHLTVGRSVAIKVLTHQWSRNEKVAERFRAEARAASAAGHPNIVEVFDAGELPDGRLYLVMEFLTGRNLFEEVEARGPMEVARACRIMRDTARAVRAAHEVGIIHRDLKPDNVMLVDRGDEGEAEFVKVLDFGISANAEDQGAERRLTVPGSAIGTPEYMAPEQCKGHPATERFDIYALGVIFFEILTGQPPMVADSFVELMARKTTQPSPSVAEARPGLPPGLVDLIDGCLALDPQARPASVRVFLARLDDVLRGLPRSGSSPAAVVATPEAAARGTADREDHAPVAARSRAALAGALGLAAALAMGLGLWLFLRGGGAEAEAGDVSGASAVLPPGASSLAGAPGPRVPAPAKPELEGVAVPVRTPDTVPGEGGADTSGAEDPGLAAPGGSGRAGGSARAAAPPTGEEAGAAAASADEEVGTGPSKAGSSPDTEACRIKRKRAADARAAANWVALKRALDRGCYADRAEYLRLRTKALAELGDYPGCVKAGKGIADPAVLRQVKICEAQRARAGG